MFQKLTDQFLGSVRKLKGQHKISESNIEDMLRTLRLSLLEADVHFGVAKKFIDDVKQKALGQDVLKGLNPGQQLVKILFDELTAVLGPEASPLQVSGKPAVVFLVGLQGVGKTTTAAKLALHIRQKLKKKPGLVPADLARPAAIAQLKTLARTNGLPVFDTPENQSAGSRPQDLLRQARDWALAEMVEVLIIDTAGRLQVDESLMTELQEMSAVLPPHEVLLVSDAMLGQQSVQVAKTFHEIMKLTGIVLTKVDGDARGGAALSMKQVTGVPIKFMGVGEKVSALEAFYPDRLARRLLDMGDVLSLVEKTQELVSQEEAQEMGQKMLKQSFNLEDFLKQIQQVKKLGGIQSMLSFLPGMGEISQKMKNMAPPDAEFKKIEAIIQSMTRAERRDPRILNGSRRDRIAKGSGTQVQDINKLVRQFEEMKKMMKSFSGVLGRRF